MSIERDNMTLSALTPVHCPQHARDEPVNAVTLLDLRHERRDPALVVCRAAEMCKDELLERVNLVLQVHQIHDGFEAVVAAGSATGSVCGSSTILTLRSGHRRHARTRIPRTRTSR